jgi:hypothetical protein
MPKRDGGLRITPGPSELTDQEKADRFSPRLTGSLLVVTDIAGNEIDVDNGGAPAEFVEDYSGAVMQVQVRYLTGDISSAELAAQELHTFYSAFAQQRIETQRRLWAAERIKHFGRGWKPPKRIALARLHRADKRWIGHAAGKRACANIGQKTQKTGGFRGGLWVTSVTMMGMRRPNRERTKKR